MRLSLDDAARLHALAELFPGQSIEEIVTDLLGVPDWTKLPRPCLMKKVPRSYHATTTETLFTRTSA